MKKMHPLQTIIEDSLFTASSYSGRGMYGKKCLAIRIDRDQGVGSLFANVLECCSPNDIVKIADAFRNMKEDSLGMDSIVYFPGIEYIEED